MKELYRIIKFGIVGVSNTAVTLASYWLLVYLGLNFVIANIIAYAIGIANSYFWNSRWVFKKTDEQSITIVKFVVVNLMVLSLNTAFLYIFVKAIGLNEYVAQIFVTPVSMVLNYILNKIWTFKQMKLS